MTTTSGGATTAEDLARSHGAALHRLAAMLTADPDRATALTAATLAGAPKVGDGDRSGGGDAAGDRLTQDLVRRYLRSAPRRAEGVRAPVGDAGDVLGALAPRARAASALRLAEGWGVDETAEAVRVSPRRVRALVPDVPGLDLALSGLADRHALTGRQLQEALHAASADAHRPAAPARRRWGQLAAAALGVAVLLGYAVDGRLAGEGGGSATGTATATPPGVGPPGGATGTADLTDAGWRLDDEGEPPRGAMSLQLRETVHLEDGKRRGAVSLPSPGGWGYAVFGVLWCDMPPAEDDHLQIPSGTVTVDGARVVLPCAGRTGSPPVSRVLALPPGGDGVLEVVGDVPPDGAATLGVYVETDQAFTPSARGSLTDAPPVAAGAVVLDAAPVPTSFGPGRRTVQSVSVSHDSTIEVWAGRTGSVSVLVDGFPATDDGELAAMASLLESSTPEEAGGYLFPEDPAEHVDWSSQQPDVRDGRWLVPVPGTTRTFPLPESARPAPGERRTVVVEVLVENVEDHLQVAVTDAEERDPDTSAVEAAPPGDAPDYVLGHRLVGRWELPGDGHLRELRLGTPLDPADEVALLGYRDSSEALWFTAGEGLAGRGSNLMPLWFEHDLRGALLSLQGGWYGSLPHVDDGVLSAAAPAGPGHPARTVLAYVRVPYDEFDFAAAAVPPDARPAGSAAPPGDGHLDGWVLVQEVVGPEDLEDGRLTLPVTHGPGLAARITTQGKGRIRFLVEGQPADALWATDGWWSSWTDEAVVSEVELSYPGGDGRPRPELTMVVEGYENFSVELLTR